MTSRPTVLASIVLALALLGDSLLYAVLPLHASTFGLSLAWAGVLLSANRIVRLFVYPLLPRAAAAGLRRFTITAAAVGALSTLVFAFGRGAPVLLASRLAWGIVFGATLPIGAAVRDPEQRVAALARTGMFRDAGAAAGPLAALALFEAAGAATVYSVAGLVLVAAAIWLAGFAQDMQRAIVRRTG